MAGITDLQTLLKSMEPILKPNEYVFTTFEETGWKEIADLHPISVFQEDEGTTLIIDRKTADENNIPYDSVFRLISLHVHSSLNAVGLTATFSTALANHGISANVVAAYYHDHIFVPVGKAAKATEVLKQLSKTMIANGNERGHTSTGQSLSNETFIYEEDRTDANIADVPADNGDSGNSTRRQVMGARLPRHRHGSRYSRH